MQLGSMMRSTTTGDDLGKTGEVTYSWVRKQGEENLMLPENTPFTLTVTATKDNSPATDNWDGIYIIEVDSIQKEAINTDNANPPAPKHIIKENGDFYIANNTTMRFTATSTTPDVWPPDMPTWGGAISGKGSPIEATLTTGNTTSVDRKQITATCGNTKSTEVIIDNVKPRMNWGTDAPAENQILVKKGTELNKRIILDVWARDIVDGDGNVGLDGSSVKYVIKMKSGSGQYQDYLEGQLVETYSGSNRWRKEVNLTSGDYQLNAKCKDLVGNEQQISRNITIVSVDIISPQNDDKVVFNTNSPGVVYINCSASVDPEDKSSLLVWSCEGTQSPTTVVWISDTILGNATGQLKLNFLPTQNAGFGIKSVKVKINGEVAAEESIKLFYNIYNDNNSFCMNNPAGNIPNWYYYWKGTSASHGTHNYVNMSNYGSYTAGDDHFHVGNAACGFNDVTTHEGIDTFAETCIHESKHKALWEASIGHVDTDGDGIADYKEAELGSNPTNKHTFSPDYDDNEWLSRMAEYSWTAFSTKSVDWAIPGQQ